MYEPGREELPRHQSLLRKCHRESQQLQPLEHSESLIPKKYCIRTSKESISRSISNAEILNPADLIMSTDCRPKPE